MSNDIQKFMIIVSTRVKRILSSNEITDKCKSVELHYWKYYCSAAAIYCYSDGLHRVRLLLRGSQKTRTNL